MTNIFYLKIFKYYIFIMKNKVFIFGFLSVVGGIIISLLGSKQLININEPYQGEDKEDEFRMDRH